MKRLLVGLVICLAVALPIAGSAQPPAATFPVIVVFHDNAAFHPFRGLYHADDRARANPAALSYLDQGVVGTVQVLEVSHGFRADHVYSHALRGFAARLTARQIDALEQSPMVAYVEADGTMTAFAQTLPWGINRIEADLSSTPAGNGSGAVTHNPATTSKDGDLIQIINAGKY